MFQSKSLYMLCLSVILSACSSPLTSDMPELDVVNENPKAKQVLQHDKDAYIFLLRDIVYTNADDN